MAVPSLAIRGGFEALRSLVYSSISGSYAKVGGPLLNPCRIPSIYNTTNVNLIVSIDGVTDQIFCPAGVGKVYDQTANKTTEQGFFLPQGTQFWVKEESGGPSITGGHIYIDIEYGIAP